MQLHYPTKLRYGSHIKLIIKGTAEEQQSKQWAAKKERKNKNYFVHVESSLDYGRIWNNIN